MSLEHFSSACRFFPSAVSELLRLAAPAPKFGCECNKNRLNFPLLQSGGVGERTPRNKEHGCFPLHLTRGPGKMSILPAIRLLCIHGSGRIPNFNLVFCPDRFFFFRSSSLSESQRRANRETGRRRDFGMTPRLSQKMMAISETL